MHSSPLFLFVDLTILYDSKRLLLNSLVCLRVLFLQARLFSHTSAISILRPSYASNQSAWPHLPVWEGDPWMINNTVEKKNAIIVWSFLTSDLIHRTLTYA